VDTALTIPHVNNGIFKWKALFLGFLSFINIKNLLAQSNSKPLSKHGITTRTAQNDTSARQQAEPFCLPEIEVRIVMKHSWKEEDFKLGGIMIADSQYRMPLLDSVRKEIK
jgi:hypothetical protein